MLGWARRRRKALFIALAVLLPLLAVYLAAGLSNWWFRRSLENRGLDAESAFFDHGAVRPAAGASGRQALFLDLGPGETAQVGFTDSIPVHLGRVRVAFEFLPAPGPGPRPALVLETKESRGGRLLARKEIPAGRSAALAEAVLRVDLGLGAKRLDYWLTAKGPGRLAVDAVRLQRGGWRWWALALWRSLGFAAGLADRSLWFDDKSAPALYQRAAFCELAHRLVSSEQQGDAELTRLAAFVAERVWPLQNPYPVLGPSTFSMLATGGELCDDQARILGDLAAALGMAARVSCSRFDPVLDGEHCVAEVLQQGRWRVLDPYLGLWFTMPDGSLAGFGQLRARPRLVANHPRVIARGPDFVEQMEAFFANRPRVLNQRRRWVTGYDGLPTRLARFWTGLLQDFYLEHWARPREAGPARTYARARHLHLLGRFQAARRAYRAAGRAASNPSLLQACLYRRAWLALDMGKRERAKKLLETLLTSHRQGVWLAAAQRLSHRLTGGPP